MDTAAPTTLHDAPGGPQGYDQQGLYQRIKKRHGQYVTRRQLYDAQRNVICELLRPDLLTGDVGQKTEGAFEHSAIVEGTGPWSLQTWQRGFMGNMVSRRSEWFRDTIKEPPRWTGYQFKGNDEVNQYLQDLTDHMNEQYNRSNYYDVMPEFVINGGSVGSPVKLFQDDPVEDRVICQVPDYASVYLDKDIFGLDNCLHVVWEWTALQAAEFFIEADLTDKVKQQLRNGNYYDKTKYIQAIYGAGDPIYRNLPHDVPQRHPWLEHYICMDAPDERQRRLLRPRTKGPGYWMRPFSTWHYHRNWNEVYSRTMAWYAIYDIRGLNGMWQALFEEAELSVRPPTWSMASMRGLLDLAPGGNNFARSDDEYASPPTYLQRPTNYQATMDFTKAMQEAVQRWFHVQMFLRINMAIENKTQPETAFALMKAEAEQTGQLAPQVETFERQVLGHDHEIFMERERLKYPAYPWGALPEPPQIVQDLSDGEVDVQFIGLLSMAQRRDREVLKFFRNIGMAEYILSLEPETRYKIRWSDALEQILEAGDMPQSLIVPADQYDAVVDAVRQRAMQEQLMEGLPKLAQAAKNLQGKTDDGSPLAALTGSAA
jgi:hypothetical protein